MALSLLRAELGQLALMFYILPVTPVSLCECVCSPILIYSVKDADDYEGP